MIERGWSNAGDHLAARSRPFELRHHVPFHKRVVEPGGSFDVLACKRSAVRCRVRASAPQMQIMDAAESLFDESQLDREVLAAVRMVWDDEKRPLLLSQLGLTHLTDPAKAFVSEHGVSLKRHARLRLADRVRFVPMPRQGGGLAPVVGTEGMSDTDLERSYKATAATAPRRPRRIRFARDVWCAFRDPLPDGARRAVDPSVSPPAVRQIGPGDDLHPGEVAVEAHETALADAHEGEVPAAAVERAILAWCAEKGLDPARFAAAPPARPASSTDQRISPSLANGTTLGSATSTGFVDVLRSIPRDQLARVSIPGDVLLSILERLVGR